MPSKSYGGYSTSVRASAASAARVLRALWPLVFLVPLSSWAERGCAYAGVDPLYHSVLWVHERLGWFVAFLAVLAVVTVGTQIAVARARLGRLLALAEIAPPRLERAFARASAELGVPIPRVAYLDVPARVATTVVGPVVLLSRGFIDVLDDDELELVARHELLHASRGDATAGVVWHLTFSALLVPGFEPLERRLHARRERRTNALAAKGREDRYVALLSRVAQGADLCADARLGLEAAAPRPEDRWLAWVAPLAVLALTIALPLSHMAFRHDLPFLVTHHC
jgi:Zn-dependent protease with chaperone function